MLLVFIHILQWIFDNVNGAEPFLVFLRPRTVPKRRRRKKKPDLCAAYFRRLFRIRIVNKKEQEAGNIPLFPVTKVILVVMHILPLTLCRNERKRAVLKQDDSRLCAGSY